SITADPTIAGIVANAGQVTSFTGSLDLGAPISLPVPNANGRFLLSNALLNQLAPGGLSDGQHTLQLAATGSAGTASASVTFTLQTAAPLVPSVHLDTTSDPGQIGRPVQNDVTILGTTSPNARVDLLKADVLVATTNTTNGDFNFSQTLN